MARPPNPITMRCTSLRHLVWAAPLLVLLLSHGSAEVATMNQDVSSLIAALGSPEETKRAEAAERLSRLDPEEVRAAALVLAEACSDDSEAVREAATGALEEMGPPAIDTLDGLVTLLAATQADTGYWAATLLGRLGGDAAAAVPALTATLQSSPHQNVRQRAAWALGKIGPEARVAIDALRKAATEADPRLARLASRAISQIEP